MCDAALGMPSAEEIYTRLLLAMLTDFSKRMANSHRLVPKLTTPEGVYRLKDDVDPKEADAVTLEALSAQSDKWRLITAWPDLLGTLLGQAASLPALADWGVATTAPVVSNASFYVQRLLEQLGQPFGSELSPWFSWPIGDSGPAGCLARARDLQREYATRLVSSMRSCVRNNVCAPAMLRLTLRRSDSIRVEALDENGRCLALEPLARFLRRVAMRPLSELADEIHDLIDCRQMFEAALLRYVATSARRLEKAVQTACARKERVGLRLAVTRMKGTLPISIEVELDPDGRSHEGSAACALSVYRPHDEFVLEGPPPESQLFYHPPCMLAARLVFTASGVTVPNPLVCQPKGGYQFCHPYTGPLSPSPLASATPADENEPVMPKASEAALKLFPQLRESLLLPMERDLCISEQQERIQALIRTFNATCHDGESADVLGLVDGLHTIAKLGLTRGQQLNISNPRARPEQMLYRLPDRDIHGIDAPYARRVFPYDPRGLLKLGL